jgi:dissimilatory sulfite reductase (desulfoviridin) alpha/beta subunit
MEWDKDALEAIERAPFFVRRLVRNKAEEYVVAQGGNRVTLLAVRECKQSFLGGKPTAAAPKMPPASEPQTAARQESPAGDFPVGEGQLRAIERLMEEKAGVNTRFYAVHACGGAVGCPLTLTDIVPLTDAIARRIAESGVPEYIESTIRGPVLAHHKFRAAVAGCPNNCSEPQIKDFAVVVKAKPGLGSGECIDCRACVETCRESSVSLDCGPVFDYDKCLACGRCAAVCPTEAITTVERGYQVMVGGKLGRHAQLATVLFDMADEATVMAALDACLEVYKEYAQGPERLGAVLNRTGIEVILKRM